VGCLGKQVSGKEKVDEDAAAKDLQRIYTGPGSLTIRDPKSLVIRYKINWEKSQVDYTREQGAQTGRLDKVSGELYQDGKVASTFAAEYGYANETQKTLRLEQQVKVIAKEGPATLNCDHLSWKTEEKLLKADGAVSIDLAEGRIGPVDELWCLPDLKKAGTPGYYAQ